MNAVWRRLGGRFFLALAATGIGASAAMAQAPGRPAAKPPFPALDLGVDRAEGARALQLLGSRLPEVAAFYGKSPDEFRMLVLRDRKIKVDRRGRAFVVDEIDSPLPASTASDGALTGTLAPLEQTFQLHSRPGSKRTIYLNFRGAVLTGTAWNSSASSINAPAFDTDGSPSTFGTAELERIQYIWQRVAEDFAPFDVNVTTEAPAPDQLTKSGSNDDVYGTTVLITTQAGVYNCSCGGVAYIGAFDGTDYYKPALVFYDRLGSGNEKYVAEAISHEAGHNMGLFHDGTSTVGYYQGHGTGVTGWAPIMGVGYYKPLVQWSKGEYADANNTQDDYVVMSSNGLPQRADDHGDTPGTATALTADASGQWSGRGVIERPGDVDLFSFTAGAGTVTVSAAPAARSPNVDVAIELRDGAGAVLASANPVDGLSASLSGTLTVGGTYHVAVSGAAKGDVAGTGYSTYGSVGLYAVTVTATPTSGTPPTAVVSATPTSGTVPLAVNFSSAGSSDSDGNIVSYAWSFGNGATATGPTASHTYQTAGTYTAELRVTDNSGLTATRSVTITANPVVAVIPMRVSDIAMSVAANRSGRARATAIVTVLDGNGQPVAGATVAGSWSGLVGGNASLTTDASGRASFTSGQTKASSGTFTFTVTGVTLNGYQYQPGTNTETSDSIAR